MPKTKLKIGDFHAQKEFRKEHKQFIKNLPSLVNALNIAFDRPYQANEMSDALVFDLGKEGVNRFSEIGLLCANKQSDGAYIILRSMFEYLVCARYLHLHPDKSISFVEYLHVQMHTVHNQIKRTYGTERLPQLQSLEESINANFEKVKEKYSYITPKGKRKTKTSWSDKGTVDMAYEVGLGDFIVPAYYFGIEKAHPSIITVVNKKDPKETASQVLMISHRMLIEILILQCEHFGIKELEPIINQCLRDFKTTWSKYKDI